jgi:hypothetical protein
MLIVVIPVCSKLVARMQLGMRSDDWCWVSEEWSRLEIAEMEVCKAFVRWCPRYYDVGRISR